MNRKGILFKIAKKCEKPQNAFWRTGNRFFFFVMKEIGNRVYRRLREQAGEKMMVFLPSVDVGDVLFFFFGKKRLEEAIGQDWVFVHDGRNRKVVRIFDFPACIELSAIQMIALNYAFNFGASRSMERIVNGYEWCMFDFRHALQDFEIEMPEFEVDREKIDREIGPHLIPDKKTVLIAPYEQAIRAAGLPLLPVSFWNGLVSALRAKGYLVFMNCKGNEEEPLLDGTIHLFPLISEIAYVTDMLGHVVTIRSGFADYVRHCSARKVILYPDRQYLDQWSVRDGKNSDTLWEFCYDDAMMTGELDRLTDRIVGNL